MPKRETKRESLKKSKSKSSKDDSIEDIKGSGRPSKKKKYSSYQDKNLPEGYIDPVPFKFLGYCPSEGCGYMIGSNDLVTKTIIVCPSCNLRTRVSSLNDSRDSGKIVATNKSEFLNTLNVNI